MRLIEIRPIEPREADKYWPGNEGRWRYLVICNDKKRIIQPFNLEEVIGDESRSYRSVMTFSKLKVAQERLVEEYLRKVGSV
jgi:hypothetical protein